MPAHWTDFPERVELFGDLFHILESLSRDEENNMFTGDQFDRRGQASAYDIELNPRRARFLPVPDRIPGWDRLATLAEREFGRVLSLPLLRVYRGRVSDVLDATLAEVDAMTVAAVADALEAGDREPEPPGPAADPFAEFRWIRVTDAAKLVWGKNTGQYRGQVSKMCDDGPFVTNGAIGPERRIDALSVVAWKLAQTD